MKYIFGLLPTLLLSASCGKTTPETAPPAALVSQKSNVFDDYWYAGEAELSTYKLEQNRYGEMRSGEAVNIFVTEPFLANTQVKADNPKGTDEAAPTVLKLNTIRRFNTGIYDYSLMGSVFTPVSADKFPHTLKATATVQDWCGQTFTQLNHTDDGYRMRLFSYFESEGDVDKNLGEAMLEDEIFTRLRINPEALPTEEVELIPSLFFARTAHTGLKPKKARIEFKTEKEATTVCVVEYLHLDRTLRIEFINDFPHKIVGWTETDNGKVTVRATLKETLKSPYWSQNGSKFAYLRDSLGLR